MIMFDSHKNVLGKKAFVVVVIFAITAFVTIYFYGNGRKSSTFVRCQDGENNGDCFPAYDAEGSLSIQDSESWKDQDGIPSRYRPPIPQHSSKNGVLNQRSDPISKPRIRLKAKSDITQKLNLTPDKSDHFIQLSDNGDNFNKKPTHHRINQTPLENKNSPPAFSSNNEGHFNGASELDVEPTHKTINYEYKFASSGIEPGGRSLTPVVRESIHIKNSKSQMKKLYYFNSRPDKIENPRFGKCEYSACDVTTSVEEADVVMLNAARFKKSLLIRKLPAKQPGQIWVMYSREPPDLPAMDYLDRRDLDNKINFTKMIYRDSTWQVKYGTLRKRLAPPKDYRSIYRKKQFDVAWFVSQCDRPSRRLEYAKRMMSEVEVHIYGRCGNMTCGSKGYSMGNEKDKCLNLLSSQYKFYLSFENTFCRDYVSEKFFNIFEDVDTVPVVRGGANYSRLFPDGGSGAYVDANDFSSPESLGKYLYDLARDEKRYVAMLKGKNRYVSGGHSTNFNCDICKRAHTGEPAHVYGNFYEWLRAPGNCWRPTTLG